MHRLEPQYWVVALAGTIALGCSNLLGLDDFHGHSLGGTAGDGGASLGTLHGTVTTLANKLVRIAYDFNDESQLQDWAIADPSATTLSLLAGQLVVNFTNRSAQDLNTGKDMALAMFIRPLKVTKVTYQVTTAETHINVYVNSDWQGEWLIAKGYGTVLNGDGVNFAVNGGWTSHAIDPALQANHTYTGEVDITTTSLVMKMDNASEEYIFDSSDLVSLDNLHHLYIGGYRSSVSWDSIVIEGEL